MTIDGASSSQSLRLGFFVAQVESYSIRPATPSRKGEERFARPLLNKRPFCPRIKKMIGGAAAALHDEKEFGSDQEPVEWTELSMHQVRTCSRLGDEKERRDSGGASGHGAAGSNFQRRQHPSPSDGSKKKVRIE